MRKTWWRWAFGKEIENFSDIELAILAQRSWDSNEGEILRECRAEAKRRNIQVA